jgi:hypothetical protein
MREPDRNLLRRSDHFNFLQIGVPSTGSVFGFVKGSREEAVYCERYSVRYHSPPDDPKQPWDQGRPRNSMSFSNM